jgi:glycosyltransferase involved in cell wall biosynthesis
MSPAKSPLVSVIIPTRNRKCLLDEAVRSVIGQTVADWELIVVNDASTDGTDSAVADWIRRDARISMINNTVASGGSAARNAGIGRAAGEFIAFLDDDDRWMPSKLEKQLDVLLRDPFSVAVSCWFTARYPFWARIMRTADNPTLDQILSANTLGGASVCLARKSAVDRIKGFSEDLASAQDWDFWVRLRQQGSIPAVRESLVDYSVHRQIRISSDVRKKYAGFRRFFCKYRSLMSNRARCDMMSMIAFTRSRATADPRFKIRWLAKSLAWGKGTARKAAFFFSVITHWKTERR